MTRRAQRQTVITAAIVVGALALTAVAAVLAAGVGG